MQRLATIALVCALGCDSADPVTTPTAIAGQASCVCAALGADYGQDKGVLSLLDPATGAIIRTVSIATAGSTRAASC